MSRRDTVSLISYFPYVMYRKNRGDMEITRLHENVDTYEQYNYNQLGKPLISSLDFNFRFTILLVFYGIYGTDTGYGKELIVQIFLYGSVNN